MWVRGLHCYLLMWSREAPCYRVRVPLFSGRYRYSGIIGSVNTHDGFPRVFGAGEKSLPERARQPFVLVYHIASKRRLSANSSLQTK